MTPRADLEHELQTLAARTGSELRFGHLYRGYADYAELHKTVQSG
ncbi:MAG: hypothetical protein AAGA50_17965 [Pseudomonadota bacterium]